VVATAQARNRRRAIASLGVAIVLLVLSAVLDTVDLRRELDAVRAARVAHAAAVAEVMEARSVAVELEATATELETLRRDQPRWTLLLASLATGLPEKAYVTSLRAAGDSVYVELEGPDVSAAFDAVRQIPWLEGLRSVSPIQRQIGEGELTERFTASAMVSWSDLDPSR
jgi:Tfp pilus assembly protein PilN